MAVLFLVLKRLIFIYPLFTLITCTPLPHSELRVLNTAIKQNAPLLNVQDHISNSHRPNETYPFPIPLNEVGPSTPLYAGANRYPFSCDTLKSGLGQPEIDNHEALGTAVYKVKDNGQLSNQIIGYSKDCLARSRLRYYAINREGDIKPIEKLAQYQQLDSSEWLLLRLEQGTINRHIYNLVMPITVEEFGIRDSQTLWNKKLIYQFAGGVGIGFRQGKINPKKLLSRRFREFFKGYAVITSSANKTSYTYNMLLAEDTAWRVKRQFISLFGKPDYTVGIGGSGGGLAQYLIAQNSPGLIDAAIPLYSYPDMVSQTIYALDCDLFNTYYHFKTDLAKWDSRSKKMAVEGLNSAKIEHRSWFYTPINQIITGNKIYRPTIYSECVHGYFGLSSLVNNPAQGFLKPIFSQTINQTTNWSYWQDLSFITAKQTNNAPALWDNEGVQYGLNGLKKGQISIEEFLHLNYHIGGWKPQDQQKPEQLLFFPFVKTPIWLTQWSRHNIYSAKEQPAKRTTADLDAIRAAYRYGQIYLGDNQIPTIDIHHYLEDELDMHHVSTSFATRLRILQKQGHSNNQLIWISDKKYTPLDEAFSMIDRWINSSKKPDDATDQCFGPNGEVIANGSSVWDGNWNSKKLGMCAKHFPIYSNSRIQAGGPWTGSIFKCHRVSVDKALESGLYAPIDMTKFKAELEQIFPDGVCDYSLGDMGNPYLAKRLN